MTRRRTRRLHRLKAAPAALPDELRGRESAVPAGELNCR